MVKEKRKSIRRAMRYTAWIGLGEGSPLRGCTVSDISETGARLELENPQDLPDVFNLLLSGRGGIYRRCRTMWRANHQIGVRFEKISAHNASNEPSSTATEPAGA